MSPRLQALQRDAGLNPAWLWIDDGRRLWTQGPRSCQSCHGPLSSMAGSAGQHPKWHPASGEPRTLMEQVQICRADRRGESAATPGDETAMALAAALVAAAHGRPITPDPAAGMQPWSDQGQRLWHQRMGQLNLACAHCHDDAAGLRLGGTRIPQGHDSGYPLYRMEWQGMGSLERRIRGCLTGVRAEPFATQGPDAKALKALEVYMRRRSAGLLIEAGALRP